MNAPDDAGPESEDHQTSASEDPKRSGRKRKHVASTPTARAHMKRSPDAKRPRGSKQSPPHNAMAVDSPGDDQVWATTDEAPSQVEDDDDVEIVEQEEADSHPAARTRAKTSKAPAPPAIGDSSFAAPPAQHSLFRVIGIKDPLAVSTPANTVAGSRRPRSDTISTGELLALLHFSSEFIST